jgi:hypothetical protein
MASNVFTVTNHHLVEYDTRYDCLYVGVEDVRLLVCDKYIKDDLLFYNGNRGLSPNKIAVEMGEINLANNRGKMQLSKIMDKDTKLDIEKNWILFLDNSEMKRIVYSWNPLVIGTERFNRFETTHTIQTPNFFRFVRGSTNGIRVGNEIWFICHIVSYEDRRFYYHLVVAIDPETFELRRYTKLFTFEKEKVEYTLGFIYKKQTDEIIVGYSTYDSSTKYICVPKQKMEELFY